MNRRASTVGRGSAALLTAGLGLWLAAGAAGAATTGDVAWDGEGGTGNPTWDQDVNWVGNEAPVLSTPGTVTFGSSGQSVVGVVEAARQAYRLSASGTHMIDLGGESLTITNRLSSSADLSFTNGTLRIGSGAHVADIYLTQPGRLFFEPGGLIDPANIGRIDIYGSGSANATLDLRDAEVVGGQLSMQRLEMWSRAWRGSRVYLDATTTMDALAVTDVFTLGRSEVNNNYVAYIGNPSDTFAYDGYSFGRFPAGVDLVVGVSPSDRASMVVGRHWSTVTSTARAFGVLRVAPGGGGSFTAYLSSLQIGIPEGSGVRQPRGYLHLAEMDACLLDAETLEIGPGRGAASVVTDNEQGSLYLPTGVATVGTATVGAPAGAGFGHLELSNTAFTVTNALVLNTTGEIVINMGASPKGLDIETGFTDGGGTIAVNFLASPAVATNWAIRIAGDVQSTLNIMIGDTRLTSTGTFPGKKVGVLYDGAYTYYAMADSNAFSTLPITIAHDERTYEMETGGSVVLGTNDIDNGSFDLDGRPLTLTLNTNGGPTGASVTLDELGDHVVTLTATAGGDSASDTCTVHVVEIDPGTSDNVTWSGAASTELMDRREWLWSDNWVGGRPPTNPTTGSVTLGNLGTTVTGVIEADRQVARLYSGMSGVTTHHTLDLGTNTLTVTNRLQLVVAASRLTVTNGTLRMGVGSSQADMILDRATGLTLGPGAKLHPENLGSLSLYGYSYSPTFDIRGAEVVGGRLSMERLQMWSAAWLGCRMYLDAATTMDAFEVTKEFVLGRSQVNNNYKPYIGDPADTFSYDGSSFGRFPAGVDLVVGVSESERASMVVGRHWQTVTTSARAFGVLRVAPGGGGSFTAYLTSLGIGTPEGSGVRYPRGYLHLAEMDACFLNAETVEIGPGRGAASVVTDSEQGALYLPTGVATVGTATVGAPAGVGFGHLELNDTAFVVTNALTLNTTGEIVINMGDSPKGLDIHNGFTDGNGTIAVHFLAAPSVGTNWAIRIAGDAQIALNGMIGDGRLTSTGTFPGAKVGVLYDGSHTYYAMADSNAFTTLPIAIAHDERTYEMAAGGSVTLGTNDIDNGSYDPDGRPLTLTLSTNGGPEEASVTFDTLGDTVVTLKADAAGDAATDTCTVHVVSIDPGTPGNVIWSGAASSELMDRREWLWAGNWVGNEAPTNPTTGTITLADQGTTVTGVIEADRQIARLDSGLSGLSTHHTLDLGTHTLTVTNRLRLIEADSRLTLTNGTLRMGTSASQADMVLDSVTGLTLGPGARLHSENLGDLSLYAQSRKPWLDLRGAEIVGGRLSMERLLLWSRAWNGSRLYLDAATAIDAFEVTQEFVLGRSEVNNLFTPYIGDPSDSFTYDGYTFGRFPAGVDLVVGVSGSERASMLVGQHWSTVNSTARAFGVLRVAPGGGGSFTAYLTSLKIGTPEGVGERRPRGYLHLAEMDSCLLDAETLEIAPGRSGALATDNEQGGLWLPPGTATVGNATIGAADGVGWGLLSLSNTVLTVTDSIDIEATGDLIARVGGVSGGVIVDNAGAGALTVADGATITLQFLEPAATLPHYGLRWAGDHLAAVEALVAAGKIVIDDTGLGKPASVYYNQGSTHVGLPPAAGTMFMVR